MALPISRLRFVLLLGGAGLAALLLVATYVWREDILRTALDPKQPFQTYEPPPAPDYGAASAWALLPAKPAETPNGGPAADVFFVHPTTFNGGRHWNGPIDDKGSRRLLQDEVLPNYAGPYVRVGRLFAPRYRQGSLYTLLSRRDDPRDARRFAYGDVRAAFETYLSRYNQGRPVVIAGVEQGASIAGRLAEEAMAAHPDLRARLVAVYLQDTAVPADEHGPAAVLPACTAPGQPRCVVAWVTAPENDLERAFERRKRAMVWNSRGQLEEMGQREALCVNPLLGAQTGARAEPRHHLGAANATGLEWGARPAFLARQVAAQCVDGLLRVSKPRSNSLQNQGSWAARQRVSAYNLFYADIEADAQKRVAGLLASPDDHAAAPPITQSIDVRTVPLRRID